MRHWSPLSAEQIDRAQERLRNPRPGSRIEAARDYGIDLTLLAENLRLPPEECARKMLNLILIAAHVRGAARRERT